MFTRYPRYPMMMSTHPSSAFEWSIIVTLERMNQRLSELFTKVGKRDSVFSPIDGLYFGPDRHRES